MALQITGTNSCRVALSTTTLTFSFGTTLATATILRMNNLSRSTFFGCYIWTIHEITIIRLGTDLFDNCFYFIWIGGFLYSKVPNGNFPLGVPIWESWEIPLTPKWVLLISESCF